MLGCVVAFGSLSHEKIPGVNTWILMKPLICTIGVVFAFCAVSAQTPVWQPSAESSAPSGRVLSRGSPDDDIRCVDRHRTEGEPVVSSNIGNA